MFAAVIAALAASASPASPAAPDPMSFYPLRALEREIEGAAVVSCVVGRDGRLSKCKVLQESPRGEGFGEAAARMAAALFRMSSKTVDGRSTRGGRVRVPITFSLPDGATGDHDGHRGAAAEVNGRAPLPMW